MSRKDILPSFSRRLDAIVLAGTDRDPQRTIFGKNKAFLRLKERPLLRHVLDALRGAQSIANIYVVGPVAQIKDALDELPDDVHPVEQAGNMLTNCWAGVHASESREHEKGRERDRMRPFLVISSDLPLITPTALDDFVTRCADDDQAAGEPYAMMVGVANESGLAPFNADTDKPGIVRPFVHFDFDRVRLANIYVVRPWKLAREDFLQTGFGYRKAIDWRNVLRLAFAVLSQKGGLRSALFTLRLQLTSLAYRRSDRLYRWLRRGNTRERVETLTSRIIGCPLRLIVTPFGGLSLDVDDESDFRALDERYQDWLDIHNKVRSEYLLEYSDAGPAQ